VADDVELAGDGPSGQICWFYDRDATPSMAEGPVDVNVFARLDDADDLFAVCRRMRLEGAKRIEIAAGK
jgi:hypothetical protein